MLTTSNTATRFSIGNTIGGFEVMDLDGRPVTPMIETQPSAMAIRDELNAAALRGRTALARALGAVDA